MTVPFSGRELDLTSDFNHALSHSEGQTLDYRNVSEHARAAEHGAEGHASSYVMCQSFSREIGRGPRTKLWTLSNLRMIIDPAHAFFITDWLIRVLGDSDCSETECEQKDYEGTKNCFSHWVVVGFPLAGHSETRHSPCLAPGPKNQHSAHQKVNQDSANENGIAEHFARL